MGQHYLYLISYSNGFDFVNRVCIKVQNNDYTVNITFLHLFVIVPLQLHVSMTRYHVGSNGVNSNKCNNVAFTL
jgi:hypothetical protein